MILYTTSDIVNHYIYKDDKFFLNQEEFNESDDVDQLFIQDNSTIITNITQKYPELKKNTYCVIRNFNHQNNPSLINQNYIDEFFSNYKTLKDPVTNKYLSKEEFKEVHGCDLYFSHTIRYQKAYSYSTVEVNDKIIFLRLTLHDNNTQRHLGIYSAKTIMYQCEKKQYKLISNSVIRNMNITKYKTDKTLCKDFKEGFVGMTNCEVITISHENNSLHILLHDDSGFKQYEKITIFNQEPLKFLDQPKDFDETNGDTFLYNKDVYFSLGHTICFYLNWQNNNKIQKINITQGANIDDVLKKSELIKSHQKTIPSHTNEETETIENTPEVTESSQEQINSPNQDDQESIKLPVSQDHFPEIQVNLKPQNNEPETITHHVGVSKPTQEQINSLHQGDNKSIKPPVSQDHFPEIQVNLKPQNNEPETITHHVGVSKPTQEQINSLNQDDQESIKSPVTQKQINLPSKETKSVTQYSLLYYGLVFVLCIVLIRLVVLILNRNSNVNDINRDISVILNSNS